MFLQQIAQTPVTFFFGKLKIMAPKFMMQDWLNWCSEVDAERKKEATEGLPPNEKFRLLNFYTSLPTTLEDLRSMVTSPKGTQRIVRTCLQRARVTAELGVDGPPREQWVDLEPNRKMTPEEVQSILNLCLFTDLSTLANELADLVDKSTVTPPTKIDEDQEEKEEVVTSPEDLDPLANSGK